MPKDEKKRGRGRPPKPGMITRSMRFEEEMVSKLGEIADDLNAHNEDEADLQWTDVLRKFASEGIARHRRRAAR